MLKYPLLSASRLPHVGTGGFTPKPRNDSADSVRIAAATFSVTVTMIGPAEFGSRWRKMIRLSLEPSARAASTNSFSLSERTTPRTMRAVGIQKNSERMKIVARMLPASPMTCDAHG